MDGIKGRRSIHSTMSSPKSPKSPRRSQSDLSESDAFSSDEESNLSDSLNSSKHHSINRSDNQSINRSTNQSTNQSKDSYNTTVIVGTIVIALCGYLIYDYYKYEVDNPTIDYNLIKNRLKRLMHKYPHQQLNNWFAFSSGIEDVIEQNRPSIFLLLYTAESKSITIEIVRAIGQLASEVLNGPKPIELEADVLNRNTNYVRDHGKFIVDYRNRLSVLILHDLNRLHPEIAKALHGICDEITPLVTKSVILLTAQVADLGAGKETYLAEMLLKDAWQGHIDNDMLWPLITRVTGGVMKIVPEK